MKTVALGPAGLTASNIVLGMMRIADLPDDEIRALVGAARDEGVTVIDHADIYGGSLHRSEQRFAEAVTLSAADRDELIIQSKVGINPDGPSYDQSYEHIVGTVDRSLEALRTDRLDVLLLHRPDSLVEPEEVARAFDDLESSGKVRAFGVSNHTPGQIELLRTAVTQPLVANQVQLSITHAPIVAQGIAANMTGVDDSHVLDGGGLLDYSRREKITLQAWSPYQAGFFTGTFLGSPDFADLNAVLDRLAAKYAVTPTAIATAWITRHPAGIQVVLGTTKPGRVREAAAGSDIPLTRPEWYELFRAAGHRVP